MTATHFRFDPILPKTTFNDTITDFNNHNQEHIIELSTKAITYVQQFQLVSFLNIRAHAYGMKGYFDKAVQDAKEIITYAPEWGIGYIRSGDLLHMQGKQSAAINLYKEALATISKQDPDYHQLVKDKKRAEEKNEKHVDIITMLPIELLHNIFEYLPETTKVLACIDISKGWREKISQSPILWRTLSDDFDGYDNETATLIAHAAPHISQHVKNLTISSMKHKKVGYMYLNCMEKGHFKSITNLTLIGKNSIKQEKRKTDGLKNCWIIYSYLFIYKTDR